MAYRFLLETPAALADAASIAVERVDDAQVVLIRPSHGLGVDDPYVDTTVAAHSLRVVDSLYDWYETLPAPRPAARIVLHGGERHPLESVDRARMVALIRRDQPWVERSIPRVGDHEPSDASAGFSVGPGAPGEATGGVMRREALGVAVVDRLEQGAAESAPAGGARGPEIRAINYLLVQVSDLRRAEDFYQDFLGLTLLGRVRRGPDDAMLPLPRDFSWERAVQTGELADISFLASGPLVLAVQRMGLGVILNQGVLEMVSLGVDSRTFAQLKGAVLMRNLTVLRSDAASFVFRDPMNVNWEIAVVGSVPLIPF
jgi:catechol 2,3-dioxygenase-like lactoylglutathione lyase family enzyme